MLALNPASIGLWVVDVDEGVEEAYDRLVERFQAPAGYLRTRKGYHAYYRLPADASLTVRNRKWALDDSNGELRGHTGYVALWDIPAVAEVLRTLDDHHPCSPFPALVEDRLSLAVDNTDAQRTVEPNEPSVRLAEALQYLGPDVIGSAPDYDDWIKIGQAVHAETGGHPDGLELWDTWSQRFENYPSGEEPTTADKWGSFQAGRADGVTSGTVYQLAEDLGWEEDLTDEFDDLSEEGQDEGATDGERGSTAEPPPVNKAKKARPVVTDKRLWTLRKVYRALKIELRYNVRRHLVEMRDNGGHWFEPWMGHVVEVRERVAANFRFLDPGGRKKDPETLVFTKQDIDHLNEALAVQNQVDPFWEWLQSLPEWDGTERLDYWIERCWKLSPKYSIKLSRWSSRFAFLGAIERCLSPGCELDEMPILIGPGGIGKSKSLKWLLPPDRQFDWFSDRFDFLAKEREMTEKMMGKVVVEASEMAGIRKAMNTHIKAAISGSAETVRLPYRPNPVTLRRMCVIIGTGDNEDLLPNDPNLRRFVPVVLEGGDPAHVFRYLNRNRNQLWAEALQEYREGATGRLPEELEGVQAEATEGYRGRDEAIEDLVTRLPPVTNRDGYSLQDLMEAVDCDIRVQKTFGQELRRRSWSKRKMRLEGQTLWRWFSPDGWSPIQPLSIRPGLDDDDDADDFENLEDDSPI